MSLAANQAHRKDIQGLRGLAVLAVVLYHANLPVPGGFLGVDVFFVISGFVVTHQIARQVAEGNRFSFADFYARRIRRLLPIYVVVVMTCIVLSVIFLSPFGEQQQAFSTARWSAFFASNLQLMNNDSYESLVGNPFRHLWSLSVEEQFYLVLPIVVIGAGAIARKILRRIGKVLPITEIVVMVLGGVSFVLALLLTSPNASESSVRWAFFSMPTRVWELGAGVVLALVIVRGATLRPKAATSLGLVGLAGVVGAVVLVEGVDGHPGLVTLVPVLSTVALLFAGNHSRLLAMVLSWKPLVLMGDVSYGWYLWHWPFVVFAALIIPNNTLVLVGASVFALAVSLITYRYVEDPIRRNTSLTGWRSIAILIGSSGLILLGSIVANRLADSGLSLSDGQEVDFDFMGEFELDQRGGNMDGSCFLRHLETTFNDVEVISRECSNEVRASETDVVLLGDSNALVASNGLFEATRELGVRAVAFTGAGCPTVDGKPFAKAKTCPSVQDTYKRLLDYLDPRVVVLINRFDLYIGPLAHIQENDHRILLEDGSLPRDAEESLRNVADSLGRFVGEQVDAGREVLIMLQPPPGVMLNRTLFERWFPSLTSLRNDQLEEILIQREEIKDAVLDQFLSVDRVRVYEPGESICGNREFCRVTIGRDSLYGSFTHINPSGSARLTDDFKEILGDLLNVRGNS